MKMKNKKRNHLLITIFDNDFLIMIFSRDFTVPNVKLVEELLFGR